MHVLHRPVELTTHSRHWIGGKVGLVSLRAVSGIVEGSLMVGFTRA